MKRLLSSHRWMLALVLAAAALYLVPRADVSWIALDEGTLGQSAERVLAGELPHRDFDDPHTGGLALLHAAAFRLLGVELTSLRWTLLFFTLLFVAACYAIASRVASPPVAGLVTLAATAWSVPIYFAGLPSWYNLFFAVFGTLALLLHLETDRRRWLVLAGACGGCSFLFKSVGSLWIAAALLFLIYREQTLAAGTEAPRSGAFRWLHGGAVAVFCTLLTGLVGLRPTARNLLYFLVPGLALGLFLLWHESRLERGDTAGRWRRTWRLFLPFGLGVAAPIAAFLVPYLASASLDDLYRGVFVLVRKRTQFAAAQVPYPGTFATVLPMALLLALPLARRRLPERPLAAIGGAAIAAVAFFGYHQAVYGTVWSSLRPLLTVVVIVGCLHLARARDLGEVERQRLFLLLATAAMVCLVQFPLPTAIYFAYSAPPLVLAALYLVASQAEAPKKLHLCALALYLVFALVWVHRGFLLTRGDRYWQVTENARLELPRAGLRLAPRVADAYRRLHAVVAEHSPEGSAIYATPDCPEVYFLTGRRNPTRTFFDFFEDDFGDPAGRNRRVLAMLDEQQINLVVVNWSPMFSGRIPPDLWQGIQARYPHQAKARPFTIHWREQGGGIDSASQNPRSQP